MFQPCQLIPFALNVLVEFGKYGIKTQLHILTRINMLKNTFMVSVEKGYRLFQPLSLAEFCFKVEYRLLPRYKMLSLLDIKTKIEVVSTVHTKSIFSVSVYV